MSNHEDWRQADRAYWDRVERIATALLAAQQSREGGLDFGDIERALKSARTLVRVIEEQRAADE